ncbi:hypothetical protein [Pseudoclavibacter sp. 13-3]|uniref:hypothetical protein n=1 Tax=Pseudoclavibacter sp. 13-3 TaxID=2901228 RepID=UPI001E2E3800|nr:hypothetical protein [Pseudoclavibacter sp. 13-3]MCD7100465.1 hypothetical protein [Pseudoclavibacter sp. 13-3]
MSRSKIIPPSVWKDDLLRRQPLPVRYTAMGLMQLVDRDGRTVVSLTLLHREIWGDDPTASPADVEVHLLTLDEIGFLTLYADPADPHTTLLQLSRPAREEHGKPSPLPAPPTAARSAPTPTPTDALVDEEWCHAWDPEPSVADRWQAGSCCSPPRFEEPPTDVPASAPKVLAWREREGAGERERESVRDAEEVPQPGDRPPYDPPPMGCPRHPNNTVTEECGPCGTAARQRKLYRVEYVRRWGNHWDTAV